MSDDQSPPRQLNQIKMRFSFFFDALRYVPPDLQRHTFSVSMSSRGDKHFAMSPKFSADTSSGDPNAATNIGVNFVHHYECTMVPLASRQSYKPHTVRIQLTNHDTHKIVVDAELNLADFMRNEKVPIAKLHVKALEPPTVLALSLAGMSLEAYKQQQQVEQSAASERHVAAAPAAAAEPPQSFEEDHQATQQQQEQPKERNANTWLDKPAYSEQSEQQQQQPTGAATNADVAQRKERDDHAAKREGDALDLEEGSEVPAAAQNRHTEQSSSQQQQQQQQDASRHADVEPVDDAADANYQSQPPQQQQQQQRQQTRDGGAASGAPAASNNSKGGAGAKPSADAIAAAAAADAERRRKEKRARGEVLRHEYERRYAEASTALQQQVRAILDDIKDNILKPTRLDVDGVKCTVPRAALRATTALVQFADHALTAPVTVPRDNWDSDDDETAPKPDTTPKLPREAGLLLFVHDLIVMLRWDICPALLDPRHTGAWLHTLLHVLNSVLQTYLASDATALLPLMTQSQFMADQNPDGPKIGLAAGADHGASSASASTRSRRRWWRSLRVPRVLRRGGKQQQQQQQVDDDAVLIPGGGKCVLSDDPAYKERSMGLLSRYSATLHAAATELDSMWGLHHERLVAPAAQRANKAAHPGAGTPNAAFPLLCSLPTTIFWAPGREPPHAHLHMASSPLWNLLADAFGRFVPATVDATAPASVHKSPFLPCVEGIMATLALELDMALHDLLCQCAQSHIDGVSELAFSALAPLRDDRGINVTVTAADGTEIAVGPGGSEAAHQWLLRALEGVYGELIASSADKGQTVDRSYMWDSPLSVSAASEIMTLCLEQVCVSVLNENHRRISRNMSAVSAKEAKKDKSNTVGTRRWQLAPLTAEGLNLDGLLVLSSADDGLFLKSRLDEIEKWLDRAPVPLTLACRASLLPLRSLCDALILPSEVFLRPHVRLEALLGMPNAMQRALFACYRDAPWEHPDDAAIGSNARADLVSTHLCPPPHHPLLQSNPGNNGSNAPPPPSASDNKVVAGPWSDPDAVALPYAVVHRSLDRDFSFLDLVTLPSPYFGSLENIDHALKRQPDVLADQQAKGVPPLSPAALTKVELLHTQAINCFRGQRTMRNSTITRGSSVTALWDTNVYRTSIGLSLEEQRREEQLFDARRGADAYVPPKATLQPLLANWDHTDVATDRKTVCRAVSDALLVSLKRS